MNTLNVTGELRDTLREEANLRRKAAERIALSFERKLADAEALDILGNYCTFVRVGANEEVYHVTIIEANETVTIEDVSLAELAMTLIHAMTRECNFSLTTSQSGVTVQYFHN